MFNNRVFELIKNKVIGLFTLVAVGLMGIGVLSLVDAPLMDKIVNGDEVVEGALSGTVLDSFYNKTDDSFGITGEGEHTVTVMEIESAIERIGELTTVAYNYEGLVSDSNCRRMFGQDVEFTRNRMTVEYEGTIRAGYEINKIEVNVDQSARVITIILPEVKVFSNEIAVTDDDWMDGFLNDVDPDTELDILEEAKEDELAAAINRGLYTEAEASAIEIVTHTLSELCEGYEFEFVSTMPIVPDKPDAA